MFSFLKGIGIYLCPRKENPNNSPITAMSTLLGTGEQGCKGYFVRSDNSLLKDRILLLAIEDWIKAILLESS